MQETQYFPHIFNVYDYQMTGLNHGECIDKEALARLLNGTPRITKKLRT
jgi:hypothetical protein